MTLDVRGGCRMQATQSRSIAGSPRPRSSTSNDPPVESESASDIKKWAIESDVLLFRSTSQHRF